MWVYTIFQLNIFVHYVTENFFFIALLAHLPISEILILKIEMLLVFQN